MAKRRKKNPNWGGSRPNAGRKPAIKVNLPALMDAADPPQRELPLESQAHRDAVSLASMQALINASRESKKRRNKERQRSNPFTLPQFPPGVIPDRPELHMAMDEAGAGWAGEQWAATSPFGLAQEGLLFLGYPYLSDLFQRPEYRTFSETIATEMTRKWIDFKGSTDDGEDGHGDTKSNDEVQSKIKELKEFMDHLKVRDRFSDLSLVDGGFGRSHLYFDFGDMRDEELCTPIGNGRDEWTKAKVGKDSLKGIKVIEPVWCYPTTYNASVPLAPDWYDPQVWYVMGKQMHKSRLLPYCTRPVPDLLKPSYAFGGLALSQIAKPYVDIWLTTRQSVADLIHSFSVMVLLTNMATQVTPQSAASLMLRIELFNEFRDNNGTFVLDKTTEDFKNVVTPLGGLHELQAQSQEHMMSVARIPAVKFTGMAPQGLNASSEGEIRTFYDTINAGQNRNFRTPLQTTIDFAQISLWGARDPRILWDFVPLWEMTEKEKGEKRKADAEVGKIHIDASVISPEEERARIAADPESGYHGLDPDDVPNIQEEEESGEVDPNAVGKKPGAGGGGAEDADPFSSASLAADAFEESQHPRETSGPNAGQFASKGGGGGSHSSEEIQEAITAGKAKPLSNIASELGFGGWTSSLTDAQKKLIEAEQHKQVAEFKASKAGSEKAKKTAFGGLWKSGEDNPAANFQMNAAHVLGKPTNAGTSYRQMLAFMIKNAASHGHAALIPALKKKLGEAFGLAAEKATKQMNATTDHAEKISLDKVATKALKEAMALGWTPKQGGQETLSTQAQENSDFAKKLIAKAQAPEPAKVEPAAKAKALVDKVIAGPPPTAAEIEKAKSKYPLGTHILPFVDEKTLKTFNDHYSGDKAPTTQQGLEAKVTAFKVLQAVNKQKEAEAKVDAEKKAAAEKLKEIEAAKANAEKNKQVMADLGINAQEAEGFNALVGMLGGNQADVVKAFKKYEDEAKSYGYPISGFEAAMIKNYSNGGYAAINKALRAGTMTMAQRVYTKMVNQAIKKMPTYSGPLLRGTTLTAEQQAKYIAGNAVMEDALTSTSISNPFGGNTNFKIKAIGKRATHIKKLSHYGSEDEVLYAAHTFFKVTKVEGKPGGQMTVHMEELDD